MKKSNFCPTHAKELMRHYCITCKHLICIECIVDHSGHEFVRKEESCKLAYFIYFSLHSQRAGRRNRQFTRKSISKDWITIKRGLFTYKRDENNKD